MSSTDTSAMREVITAAATAEVAADRPPIYGTVVVHCLEGEEPLRLSMPMLDALLLLNSLRAIEQEFDLQEWAARLGCSLNAIDKVSAELDRSDNDGPPARAPLNG